MLRATGISRWQGGQVILAGISVSLDAGDRVGVVGPNGIGKSTFLRILAGLDDADEGRIERRPTTLTVGYLPQEPDPSGGETLLDYLRRRTGVTDADRDLDERTEALAHDPDALDAYTAALERFLALGGDDIEVRAAETCASVGLLGGSTGVGDERLHQTMATLSGGEAARALLAAILLSRFDVLLLDEPTNNLDFAGLDQLEAFVHDAPGAVMVVSHDRAFLDRAVTRILEIQEHSHEAREFAGGWTEFIAGRDLARGQQYEAHEKYVSERDRLKDRARTQTLWSEGGVRKVKRSGETDKHLRARKVARSEKQASKAKITEKAIERLEVVDKPWEGWRLDLQLQPTARSGDVVARLDRAVIARRSDGADHLIDLHDSDGSVGSQPLTGADGDAGEQGGGPGFELGPIDLEIGWQDRVGIIGRNGAGKSTLIGGLLGTYPVVRGTRWLGPGVVVGELDQSRGRFAGDDPLLGTFLRESALPLSEARSLLAKFGLTAEHVDRDGSSLSPGERSRALLALLMAGGVNCLVLDEPTNHLDLAAIEQLESALAEFEGTLVVVSHDRRFLEALALTHTIDL